MRDLDLALQQFELEPSTQHANDVIQLLILNNINLDSLATAQQLLLFWLKSSNIPYQIKKIKGSDRIRFIIPVYARTNSIWSTDIEKPRSYLYLALRKDNQGIIVTNITDYGETEHGYIFRGNYLDLIKQLPELLILDSQSINNLIIETIQMSAKNSESFEVESQSVTEKIASFPQEKTYFHLEYKKYPSDSPIKLNLTLHRAPWRDFLEFRIHENISYRDMSGELHQVLDMALSGPYARNISDEEEQPHLPEWDRFLSIVEMQSIIRDYIKQVREMNL